MTGPYRLPHECESIEITDKLATLTPRQRQALRMFVWQVDLGSMALAGWLESVCPIDSSAWHELCQRCEFQAVLSAYEEVARAWLKRLES